MDRIDLPLPVERLNGLSGALLDAELDEELQAIVEEASLVSGAPIGLVSLVLQRIQFFRAYRGLPTDLAVARATDREVSFCQFVVRDGAPFEVTDAVADQRIPKELVDLYGIRAYLGMPVRVGERVLGSLCVIDVKPRTFSARERDLLAKLALRASKRLAELAFDPPRRVRRLLDSAAGPALGELRNLLVPLEGNVKEARLALAELRPALSLTARVPESGSPSLPALAVLSNSLAIYEDLKSMLEDLSAVTRGVRDGILALDKLLVENRSSVSVDEVVAPAANLAHHVTKLVGGVQWSDASQNVHLQLSRAVAVNALAALLAVVASGAAEVRATGGLRVAITTEPSLVRFRIQAPLDAPGHEACAATLAQLLQYEADIAVMARKAAVEMTLPRA